MAVATEQNPVSTGAENAAARELVPEITAAEDTGTPPVVASEPPQPRPTPQVRPDKRSDIAARFREKRGISEADEDAAEIREFTQSGIPPEMREAPPAVEPAAEATPPVAAEPAAKPTRKVVVFGNEMEIPEDELIAHAQKSLAAEHILDEAKRVREETRADRARVDELLRSSRDQGQRPAQPAADQHGPEGTQPTDGADQPDPYAEAIRQIAYEDPEQAAQTLRSLIATETKSAAEQAAHTTVKSERQRDELGRNRAALADFKDKNPDIANDVFAVTVVKTKIAQEQLNDLAAVGYSPDVLPKPSDLDEIGRWHLFARSEGLKVRSIPELLETGIKGYKDWKGGGEKPAASGKTTPRIEVTLDRAERRQHIPQQPTRTVTPRPDQTGSSQPTNRSAVVEAMKQRTRGTPRGRVA